MSAHRAVYPVAAMCRVLGVSSSGYYAWAKRTPSARAISDAALIERIGAIHAASHGTYGSPRVQAELAESGLRVSRKRIARLMKAASLAGVSRRRFVTTTVRDGGRQAADLVERAFKAEAPASPQCRDRPIGWVQTRKCVEVLGKPGNLALERRQPVRDDRQPTGCNRRAIRNIARDHSVLAEPNSGGAECEIGEGEDAARQCGCG